MPIIPIFVQNPVVAATAGLLSRFNFCHSGDEMLPFSTGSVSALDRQHLWGLVIGIALSAEAASLIAGCSILNPRVGESYVNPIAGESLINPTVGDRVL